mmetsp:Transcript_4169/g.7996  ORF Transcript_4169/g.7996 Transcript_4169/m.7996 type:complete len:102 (-) Transcript_4169:112-417(-)
MSPSPGFYRPCDLVARKCRYQPVVVNSRALHILIFPPFLPRPTEDRIQQSLAFLYVGGDGSSFSAPFHPAPIYDCTKTMYPSFRATRLQKSPNLPVLYAYL